LRKWWSRNEDFYIFLEGKQAIHNFYQYQWGRRRRNDILTLLTFILSGAFFIGMFKCMVNIHKPGIYPPKKRLKRRAGILAAGGGILLILGMIFSLFS
jgi:hypothetical protein